MFERKEPTIPFVNLHAHDVAGSPFDALGYAPEHMDFAYQNGLTAHAITNHGNMNHLPNQILHLKKMRKEGKEFKNVYGSKPTLFSLKRAIAYEENKEKKKKEKANAMAIDESEEKLEGQLRRDILSLSLKTRRGYRTSLDSYQTVLSRVLRFPRIDYALWRSITKSLRQLPVLAAYTGRYWRNREEGDEAV